MPKVNARRRLEQMEQAQVNREEADARSRYFGAANYPHAWYRPLRRDDSYYAERDRAIAPLKGPGGIHDRAWRCARKGCHYGLGVDDGWCARIKWEMDTGTGPHSYAAGYESALDFLAALTPEVAGDNIEMQEALSHLLGRLREEC